MQPVKTFRTRALDALRGNWKQYVLATLVYVAVTLVILVPFELMAESHPFVSLGLFYPALFLVCMPLAFGYRVGFYDKFRGEEAPMYAHMCNLFKQDYGRALKAFCVLFGWVLLMMLGVCLVAALLTVGVGAATGDMDAFMEATFLPVFILFIYIGLIPVLVWAYGVSQLYFLAHVRKDLSIRECLKLSQKMMKGHKWQLFCLQLSFIGWGMLCVLTLFIGTLWLNPYQGMAEAIFFEDLYKAEFPEEVPAEAEVAPVEVAE